MDNHHDVRQAIERVCHRQQSLSSAGDSPSYFWWYLKCTGETQIEIDTGKLAPVLRRPRSLRGQPDWRYVAAQDLDADKLIPAGFKQNDYIFGPEGLEAAAFRMGIGIGQRVLTRYRESWSTDYWGESDCDIETEIIFAEDHGPFPLCIDTGFSRRPTMERIRLA